ncbi:unnamed protein product [Linum trigynum]|uniref:Uncharacterized protein n=1 Tax=Linum trigynum TaxID=586398 RepID=A0AAV2GCV8_9ROSI
MHATQNAPTPNSSSEIPMGHSFFFAWKTPMDPSAFASPNFHTQPLLPSLYFIFPLLPWKRHSIYHAHTLPSLCFI